MGPTYLGPDDDDLVSGHPVPAGPGGRDPVYVRTRVEITWWPIVISVGASVVSAALAVVLCLGVSSRNAQRGIEQRKILTAQAEVQHQTLCALIVSLDDNARDVPPTTELGQSNARTYASLRVSQGCPPREGK